MYFNYPKEQELNNFDAFLYRRTAVRPFRRQNIRFNYPKEQELNNFDAFLYGRTAVRPFRRQNIRFYLIHVPKLRL
jgi:hypothetical protein